MINDTLFAAIRDYFRGERQEMLAILIGTLILAVAASALYVVVRDGFAKGFAVTVLLAAVALSSTAVSLLRRDPGLQTALDTAVRSPSIDMAVAAEAARVAEILRRYPYYRAGALVIGLIALAAVAITGRAWVHGAAAGVMILVASQLAIDHYSQQRAAGYATHLDAALRRVR